MKTYDSEANGEPQYSPELLGISILKISVPKAAEMGRETLVDLPRRHNSEKKVNGSILELHIRLHSGLVRVALLGSGGCGQLRRGGTKVYGWFRAHSCINLWRER
jgi:hypothetical protein